MNEKIKETLRKLEKEEIKRMLIVATKSDSYSAKCFAMLLLENEVLNNKDNIILEEFIDLLSIIDERKAVELIKSNF